MKTTPHDHGICARACDGCQVYVALHVIQLPARYIMLCDNCAVTVRKYSKAIMRNITERNTQRNLEEKCPSSD